MRVGGGSARHRGGELAPMPRQRMQSMKAFCRGLCATVAIAMVPLPSFAASDPWEGLNRRVHAFNRSAQTMLLNPLARLYISATPAEVRRGVANALGNLGEPVTAVSGLAAGRFHVAAHAVTRFGINTTLGLGGVQDRAAGMGYPRQEFSVADAICSWGVPSGPFLVLPLLGPSTLRDAGGQALRGAVLSQALGADLYLGLSSSDAFVNYSQVHEDLDRVEQQSLDAYALLRSAYLQRRAAKCVVDQLADVEEPDDEGG